MEIRKGENENFKRFIEGYEPKDSFRTITGGRAVITCARDDNFVYGKEMGVYIHSYGGYDFVQAFLTYCKLKGYRDPKKDDYGWARLCQVIANCIPDGLGVGVDTCDHLDCANGNYGVYMIDGWDIVDRKYFSGREDNDIKLSVLLEEIDNCQPVREQLGPKELRKRYLEMR